MILSWRTLLSVGVSTFILCLIAFMPATVALSTAGKMISYSSASGTVWQAQLRQAAIGGRAVGDVDISLSPLALLGRGLDADIAFRSQGESGSFSLSLGDKTKVSELTAALDLAAMIGRTAMTGVLSARDVSVTYSGTRCEDASGQFRTNILESGFAPTGVQAPVLAGVVACEDGVLVHRFSGENEVLAISGSGEIQRQGRPSAEVLLRFKVPSAVTPDLKIALEFAGLRETTDGWRGQLNLDL